MVNRLRNGIKENPSGSEKGPGSPSCPGTGVWLRRKNEPVNPARFPRAGGGRGAPGEPGPHYQPPARGVSLAQWAAAQAGAPPRGAQSPALTQLKAGVASPPFRRRLRSHSPAEVIMAAPRTSSPARSLARRPGRAVYLSAPCRSLRRAAWLPGCPAQSLFRPPARFSPRTPPASGLPTVPPAAWHEFSPGLCLPCRHCRPASRGRVHGELHGVL